MFMEMFCVLMISQTSNLSLCKCTCLITKDFWRCFHRSVHKKQIPSQQSLSIIIITKLKRPRKNEGMTAMTDVSLDVFQPAWERSMHVFSSEVFTCQSELSQRFALASPNPKQTLFLPTVVTDDLAPIRFKHFGVYNGEDSLDYSNLLESLFLGVYTGNVWEWVSWSSQICARLTAHNTGALEVLRHTADPWRPGDLGNYSSSAGLFRGQMKNDVGSAIAQSHHWQLDYVQQCKPLCAINLGGWRESLRAINLSKLGATHYTPLIFGSEVRRLWPQAERVLQVTLGSLLVSEYRAFINTKRWSAV